MPIYDRTRDSIIEEFKGYLKNQGFDISDSSVNMSFVTSFAISLETFYSKLSEAFENLRPSSSAGQALDAIGERYGLTRLPGESDDNYRYRLFHSSRNRLYVFLLSDPRVKDIRFIPYTSGVGSGTIVLITHNPFISHDEIKDIEQSLENVSTWGLLYNCITPKIRQISLDIQVKLNPKLKSTHAETYKKQISDNVRKYISSLQVGEDFVLTKMYHVIYDTRVNAVLPSDQKPVFDARIIRMLVDGLETRIDNVVADDLERIITNPDPDSILVF